jgi:putative flippase GtrA
VKQPAGFIYAALGGSGILRQFARFGLVGISNTFIHISVYFLLVFFGVHYLASNTAAFIISVMNAYYWNGKYVFRKQYTAHSIPLAKSLIAYGATYALSQAILYVCVELLRISQWIAPVIALLITIPGNFLLNKLWTFRK